MTEPRCTCYEPDAGFVFNPNPGVRCKKHPHCLFDHAEMQADKTWKFPDGNTFELGAVVKGNGMLAFKVRCVGCGKTSGELKKADFLALVERGVLYTWTRDAYAHADTHVCQVRGCGRKDTELHHFAPRNMFPDADNWPVLPLCRDHHRMWHTTMNGYRFQGITATPVEDWHGKVRRGTA